MNRHQLQHINIGSIPPEGFELSGNITSRELDIENEDRIEFPAPVEYRLCLSMVRGSLLVRGTVSLTARARCDRCLHYYDLPVTVPDLCLYFENITDEVIDLTDSLREDIVLALPQRLVCHEECRGLCPGCGINLNIKSCQCPSEPEGDSVWDKLDSLDL